MSNVELVYSPKDEAEGERRHMRAKKLVGVSFVKLPDVDKQAVAFVSTHGQFKITYADVMMVFNDALLADYVSDYGVDGPLYKDTLEGKSNLVQKEAYNFAVGAYKNVDLPSVFRMPEPAP